MVSLGDPTFCDLIQCETIATKFIQCYKWHIPISNEFMGYTSNKSASLLTVLIVSGRIGSNIYKARLQVTEAKIIIDI